MLLPGLEQKQAQRFQERVSGSGQILFGPEPAVLWIFAQRFFADDAAPSITRVCVC